MHSPAAREQAMRMIHSGLNDCEVARRTGIARTTIRDWRHAPEDVVRCPRCWRRSRRISFDSGDYAELLGLYLGDGYIVRTTRTWRLRIYLDSKHEGIVRDTRSILTRSFGQNAIGVAWGHRGRMTILSVHSSHLPCLFPQHGPGKKHERVIALEPWQEEHVAAEPWRFLRGCIRSDGCVYINRTGPYEYLSYDFLNYSEDILDLFCGTCSKVGVEFRRYSRSVRIYRRSSVALMESHVGLKR